jgi:hypothetical protein
LTMAKKLWEFGRYEKETSENKTAEM